MQVEVDVKCMQANFGGYGIFIWLPFKFGQISLLDHGPLYSMGGGGQRIELGHNF